MSTYTPKKLVKTMAGLLAATSLIACSSGGSGGGEIQPVGKIQVADVITINDTITVEVTDCSSKDFNATLDGINVTALFTDIDDGCKKTVSAYSLQGILGEKAQAKEKSKLVIKASSRTNVEKSFAFKAWPEFAFQPSDNEKFTAKIFNALPENQNIENATLSGDRKKLDNIKAGSYKIKASSINGGLVNNFEVAGTGTTVKDAWVIKLAETVEGNKVFADWLRSYLSAKGHGELPLKLSFYTSCNHQNSICLKVAGLSNGEAKITISGGGQLFTATSDDAQDDEVGEILTLLNTLSDVLDGQKNSEGISKEITTIGFEKPSTIRVETFIQANVFNDSYNTINALSYFMEKAVPGAAVENANLGRNEKSNTYIAVSSSAINQQLLASALVNKLNIDSRKNQEEDKKPGPILLCESKTKCLRDDIMKDVVAVIRHILDDTEVPVLGGVTVNVGKEFSDKEIENLIKAVIPVGAKLQFKLAMYRNNFEEGAAPYIRYLESYNEVAASDSRLQLILEPAIKPGTVCRVDNFLSSAVSAAQKANICKDFVLPQYEGVPATIEGKYGLEVNKLIIKQRMLDAGVAELLLHMPESAETKLFEAKLKDDNIYPKLDWAEISRKEVLPLVYDFVGPVMQELLAEISELDKPTPEIDLVCNQELEPKVQEVLEAFFNDGEPKKVSFMNGEAARDKVGAGDTGAKEAKHLIMGGLMKNGLDPKRDAGLTITYKACD